MKISVITVVFNGEKTIEDTILSVADQSHHDVEHIIIDGASTDQTMRVVRRHNNKFAVVISEPDRGIYDAMNKGIRMASGEVVGFLNADDVFASKDVLRRVAECLEDDLVDACFGDLVYVRPGNKNKVIRYYKSNSFTPARLCQGVMPAHPTIYIKRSVYEILGGFRPEYKIAGDFELVARYFGKAGLKYRYLPMVMVKMGIGGVSTRNWKSNVLLNREIYNACINNNINTNILYIYSKYLRKIFQLLDRP